MFFSLFTGFLLGAFVVVTVEALILLSLLRRLSRRKEPVPAEPPSLSYLTGEQSLSYYYTKQGSVWVLESEKIPKSSPNNSLLKVAKEQKNNEVIEVSPVKRHAKIRDCCLILTDVDGSQTTIQLIDCTIVAVSASNLSSRKWAKRYPIKVESRKSVVYNESKTYYLFLETSWEKESWCKALRLATCSGKEKINWYAQLSEEFHQYLASLNAEYPSFLKPSATTFGDVIDKVDRIDGSSSKVRHFLKKFAKKATKGAESKESSTTSSSNRSDRKIGDKLRTNQDVSSAFGLTKSSSADKSLNSSLLDMIQPTAPPSNNLGNQNQVPIYSDAVYNEKCGFDEGTLCWNLFVSRLFFDAKRSTKINSLIEARIQRALSNMRTPSYIGGVTCTGLDLGNLPPYIHHMRVLPMDLNEVWAVEVDIEYSGGLILDIETRLDVREPDFQKGIIDTSFESSPAESDEVTSDLLEGIEHYGNQLKFSTESTTGVENRDEGNKPDGLRQSKSTSWTSTYVSRWKSIVNTIADQVSQVPLSLAIRVISLRGTLRVHIKPPPSDQLWLGFTSMPEMHWNLDSCIGDRKITSGQIALVISNRIKAAIRETLVLPNCESICIPWMLAEKDDWVPRKVAPFVWVRQEGSDLPGRDASNSQIAESKVKSDGSKINKFISGNNLEDANGKIKSVVHGQLSNGEPSLEFLNSEIAHTTSLPTNNSSGSSNMLEDLRVPLLRNEESQDSCSRSGVASPENPLSAGAIVSLEEHLTEVPSEEDLKPRKIGRRARMMDLGKKMSEKLEEKRRHIEEKGRNIVEKMRENART